MQTLNSPLELGLRALVILTAAFPRPLDVDRLVLMDYCLLHSADLGGPTSVLPAITTRGGELGIKRSVIELGIQMMARAGMIEVVASTEGLTYRASEASAPFLRLVSSPLLHRLTEVAEWAVADFGDSSLEEIRERIRLIADQWSAEWTEESLGSERGLELDDEENPL